MEINAIVRIELDPQTHHHFDERLDDVQALLKEVLEELAMLRIAWMSGAVGHTSIRATAEPEPKETEMTDHMKGDFAIPSSHERAAVEIVGPRKAAAADGMWEYASRGTLVSSDDTIIGPIEDRPDAIVKDADGNPVLDEKGGQIPVYRWYANTPLEPEPGDVVGAFLTWSSDGMASVDRKFTYSNPDVGHAEITATVEPEA